MKLLEGVDDSAALSRVLDHYRLAGPLMSAQFADAPLVFLDFPDGFANLPHYHITDVPLNPTKILWAVHAYYAIEFHTWASVPSDENRLRFARILLELPEGPFERVKEAALAMRAALFEVHMEAIALIDGRAGIALWVPLADMPLAETVRAWLHQLCAKAVARHPALLTMEPNTHRDGRVHIHVSSNAPDHFSAVPYSLRGADNLPMCTPIAWEELGTVDAIAATAATFPERLKKQGDVFAQQLAPIAGQTLPPARVLSMAVSKGHTPEPRGRIITAAIDILDDGKARTADELCAEAIKRGLVPNTTKRKYVYSALIEYIARAMGRNRKPPIVQDAQRRFRINEPPDDWPDLVPLAQPAIDAATQALCDRLDATATGDDPAAFEIAVCDAFAHLGFLTQHLGGHGQADGVADAILGSLGYRVVIECKTAKTIVNEPDCAEVAKEMASLAGAYGVLVGPAFSDETELLSELQTHKVTALTVADLQTLLQLCANALEVQAILVPGYAGDVLTDFLWNRQHGPRKRVAAVAAILQQEAWKAQTTAATQGGPLNAPRLTIDSAMLLVDEALRNDGAAHACTREEVQAAFAWLTNPIVGRATTMTEDAIVVFGP